MKNIGTLGALALLTACSGIGSHVAPAIPGGQAAAQAAARAPGKYNGTVFVSDLDSNTVWSCPVNFKDIRLGYLAATGQLQGVSDPSQLAVDAKGTLYVANAQYDATGAGTITEYSRGATSPTHTLKTGLNTTTGVAVDSRGTVYASNKYFGSIVAFPEGKSVPSETITSNLVGPDSLAVDAHDNLYIADSSANDVLELKLGSHAPRSLGLQKLARPTGIALDSHGNIFVSNDLGAKSTVAMYPPGQTSPKETIVVPGPPYSSSEGSIGEPAMLSVTKPGDIVIVSAPLSLVSIGGEEWFGYAPAVVGYAPGKTQPLWSQYQTTGYDTIFQPEK
ncbi:MAG TPA: hypothetical protein VGI19_06685 [Candidatus Cybelea sp.]|jgi:hypothetical protein